MDISPQLSAVFAAVFTLAGVIVAQIFNTVTNARNRKSEERRHYRQLIINAAIENWKYSAEVAIKNKGAGGREVLIQPLDDYIIHMVKFSELMLSDNITASNIEEKVKELDTINIAVRRYRLKTRNEESGN